MTGRSILCLAALACSIPLVPAQTPPPSTPPQTPAPQQAAPQQAAPQQAAVPSGSLILAKTVPFQVGQPIKLDMVVGGLRVPDLKIDREEGSLLDSALPPRGGQSRFSWMRYTLAAENPGTESWTLRARIRLLDKNGAIIDEFEFGKKIGKGRARAVELRRISLNYVVPLIDRVEVMVSGER